MPRAVFLEGCKTEEDARFAAPWATHMFKEIGGYYVFDDEELCNDTWCELNP